MEGNIDFSGTLKGSIADSGGGGGSTVTITPTLESGTKIADYTIDETSGSLYAPNSLIESVSSPLVLVGKDLRVDLSSYYTKAEMQIELQTYQRSIQSIDDQLIISGTFNNQLSLSFDIDNYQEKLTAGTGIDITGNVISCTASGGGIDYSTSEQDTGLLWIDGRHIYQRTFQNSTSLPNNTWTTTGDSLPAGSTGISCEVICGNDLIPVWFEVGADGHIELLNIRSSGTATLSCYTVRYVKSV